MRYIEADKLIEEIKERIKAAIEWGKSAETEEIKIRAEQAIATFCEASLTAKKLSTADVRENVRGEWRTTYFDHVAMGERPKILYCSVCNQCIAYPTNYCPNCGADMRG